MDVEILRAIGANIGLLLVAATFVAVLSPKRDVISSYSLGLGGAFGLLIAGSLLLAFEVTQGVIIDLRFVPAILSGIMGGPLAALAAVAIGASTRWYLGGAGWLGGIFNMLIPAILGTVCWYINRHRDTQLSLLQLMISGLLSGCLSVLPVLIFIPASRDWPISQLADMLLPPTLASLLALLLIGLIWRRIELLVYRASTSLDKIEHLGSELMKSRYSLAHANQKLQRTNEQLEQVQQVTISTLARLAEARDQDTGNHILRTQHYVELLANQLYESSEFQSELTPEVIDLITKSTPLHDIGKVGIPDTILLKPGKLTTSEFEIMKTHTLLGADAIEAAERDVNQPIEFLRIAKQIIRYHHERWDGTGYPSGLQGEAIPLAARLMAVADVFDALVNARVYKEAFDFDYARTYINQESGKHFDPTVVKAFNQRFDDFVAIAERYRETSAEQLVHQS